MHSLGFKCRSLQEKACRQCVVHELNLQTPFPQFCFVFFPVGFVLVCLVPGGGHLPWQEAWCHSSVPCPQSSDIMAGNTCLHIIVFNSHQKLKNTIYRKMLFAVKPFGQSLNTKTFGYFLSTNNFSYFSRPRHPAPGAVFFASRFGLTSYLQHGFVLCSWLEAGWKPPLQHVCRCQRLCWCGHVATSDRQKHQHHFDRRPHHLHGLHGMHHGGVQDQGESVTASVVLKAADLGLRWYCLVEDGTLSCKASPT